MEWRKSDVRQSVSRYRRMDSDPSSWPSGIPWFVPRRVYLRMDRRLGRLNGGQRSGRNQNIHLGA